jgi:hypothetical protein
MEFGVTLQRREIEVWLEAARDRKLFSAAGLVERAAKKAGDLLFPQSIQRKNWDTLAAVRLNGKDALLVIGPNGGEFKGERFEVEGQALHFCPMDKDNAGLMRRVLPFTAPSALGGREITFGVGDRLGFASPGHLRLFSRYQVSPVVAQQSVRELSLTCRTYEDVLAAATWAVFQTGFDRPWGADGDHLKTVDWVKKALAIGFTMITADVSDYIRGEHQEAPADRVEQAYGRLDAGYRRRIESHYLDLALDLDTGETVRFTREELARAALVYREAVEHAERMYRAGMEVKGAGGFDFELSVDETATPTTPQAHLFVAQEAQRVGVTLSSLAPRFVGEFQKGIDYIGDPEEFRRTFRTHAAIARRLGYRISIHSGSDKFTIFPIVGEESRGRYHLKTAGTNWLEALRVIARVDPPLFRQIYRHALANFEKARANYHVTTNLDNLPDPATASEAKLLALFAEPDARQVLHITYGEILGDAELSRRFYEVLRLNIEGYWQALEEHIGRHLELLGVPRRL